MLYYNSI